MTARAKELAKPAIEIARTMRYHWIHRKEAFRILDELKGNGIILASRDRRKCDNYAKDMLGHICFAPWLYVYCCVSGGFKEGWIPDNYYGSVVVPRINGKYSNLSLLKPLNSVLFHSEHFPDLLSYVNGIFFDRRNHPVAAKDVKKVLFQDQDSVIFKLDNTFQGKGIHIMSSTDFSLEQVERLGNGLFQAWIRQHSVFSQFAKRSVATLRLTSLYHQDGEVSVKASYLRFGDKIDTHVRSGSHIRVPIGLTDGAFSKVGYTPHWIPIKAHPTSKEPFEGHSIPNFKDCIKVATRLHKQVPYTRCIGWDMAVDVRGKVKLMEWNAQHNDIKFSEATQGPCFVGLGWEKLNHTR